MHKIKKVGARKGKLPSHSAPPVGQESELLPEFENITNWLQSSNISVVEALDKDRENEKRKEEGVCWFHENTTRNLAERKLKEGK